MNFGKRGVHHQDQADGNGDVGCANLELIDEVLGSRDQKPQSYP